MKIPEKTSSKRQQKSEKVISNTNTNCLQLIPYKTLLSYNSYYTYLRLIIIPKIRVPITKKQNVKTISAIVKAQSALL